MSETTQPVETAAPAPRYVVMDMLVDHIPLSLLLDLAAPAGPHSTDILADEGPAGEAWWEGRPGLAAIVKPPLPPVDHVG